MSRAGCQPEERIELGLGLKRLTFDADGDTQHIHNIIDA